MQLSRWLNFPDPLLAGSQLKWLVRLERLRAKGASNLAIAGKEIVPLPRLGSTFQIRAHPLFTLV
jgi:hypothetical protein